MQKFLFCLITLSILFTSGCQISREHAIIGQWQGDYLDASGSKMNYKDSLYMAETEGLFRLFKYEFFKDKTYTISVNSKMSSSGHYEFINDGKYLLFTSDQTGKRNFIVGKFELINLINSEMILRISDDKSEQQVNYHYRKL